MACSGQQGFAAVQDQADLREIVGPHMLGDALGRALHRAHGHGGRTPPPTLVGVLEYVAMVTCEITPAVHLEHELPERC
ncbi:hypothetical protein GCM10009546_49860 [Actinomadura livida]|uniref:Uncharacterized protein n=1 Tax=Actinomadura livida TaxID=79909 RepID=A0ABN1F3G4_9ACTN|nr:hypothetical protein GCM10010208_52690 [Actinomadura livida]